TEPGEWRSVAWRTSRGGWIRRTELTRGPRSVTARLLEGARPTADNAFKIPLVERTIAAVLAEARA
ncbi:MAG: molybdopterin dehydrogenase, partial [Tardiphaga sp.]|nr:molybdopterin dehydrogenase [Tardiphaga sp.]